MTLNYPSEGMVVTKANAVVGALIRDREIAPMPHRKFCREGANPLMCVKKNKIKMFYLEMKQGSFKGILENLMPKIVRFI